MFDETILDYPYEKRTYHENEDIIEYSFSQEIISKTGVGGAMVSLGGDNSNSYSLDYYDINLNLHNHEKPASILRIENLYRCDLCIETYYHTHGKLHRENGPAIHHLEDGVVTNEEYYEHGTLHKLGEPACIKYNKNGNIIEKTYSLYGLKHRIDGPAYIEYDDDGKVINELFFLNDNKIDEEVIDSLRNWCSTHSIPLTLNYNDIPPDLRVEFKLKFT